MKIEVNNVTKRFGNFVALNGVDLEIKSGELVALLGPSGSGKTTLLRIIAGLEWPDAGAVYFDGRNTLTRKIGERHVGFVFQHYALFRHMTVFENVAFGLRSRPRRQRPSEDQIRERVLKLLNLVQLAWLADRYPNQLSGGQRQRIALARALATEPQVLLLDEPFGALDAKVRKELRRWLRNLHEEIHVTSVFVTHDQEEALEVADRVVVMDQGNIEQIGKPADVYDNPATAFVHEFIGDSVIIPLEIINRQASFEGSLLDFEPVNVPDGSARLFVRPFEISVVQPEHSPFRGVVKRIHGLGASKRAEVLLGSKRSETIVEIDAAGLRDLKAGELIGLQPRLYRIFPTTQQTAA